MVGSGEGNMRKMVLLRVAGAGMVRFVGGTGVRSGEVAGEWFSEVYLGQRRVVCMAKEVEVPKAL